MTQVVFRSLLYPRAKQAACFVVIQKYVASTAAAKWSAMPLTLQVSNMFSEMPKGRGVLHNVKGAKDLMIGFGLQTPSGKEWACNLVPAHAIERRFYI